MVIPERFTSMIDAHMLGNMLGIEHYPLILAIVGQPGMGKTYQLRNYLNAVGVSIISASAADLESDRAGEPAKLLQQKYIEASCLIQNGEPAVLLIDDIDTTLGEWENYTGTVNHQDILAFLMHIADNPQYIENVGQLNRVPVFFTGNDINRLYKPLIREGRAKRFDWEPTKEEKIPIIASIFSLEDETIARDFVDAYPNEKISFFSDLMLSKKIDKLSLIGNTVVFKHILTQDGYRENLLSQYHQLTQNIQWGNIARKALQEENRKETCISAKKE